MPQGDHQQPRSLTTKAPSWPVRAFRRFVSRIDPEIYSQSQGGPGMTRYGLVKASGGQFGEISASGSQFAIERPGGGAHINPEKALANNRGYVYAAVNAKAREIQNIDFRLFEVDGKDHSEKTDHPLLDLLDSVNPDMIGSELKYLTSSHLDLVGNSYWLLTDKNGNPVKGELDKPDAIYLLDPSRIHPVIDDKGLVSRITGYKIRLKNGEQILNPGCVIQLRAPDASNFFEGRGIVQAGAEYIDNDNYAMEFNRRFFMNGARPAGFLETEGVAEAQLESIKVGFADVHEGIENMNRIAILPKGVKWSPAGTSPKDMDFKNLSEDMRDRILALFGVSKTILGTAESDTNRATAETADYVFSKRVVKPHMQRICDFLNEKLVPRYGDNLYISFIDPVPEDRGARTDEMQKAVGSQPILTVNEARDEYMGLGPVDGGDALMAPTTMAPIGEADGQGDVDPGTAAGKEYRKVIEAKVQKAANGARVAFRPVRTKLQTRAKQRQELATGLAKSIVEDLKKNLDEASVKAVQERDEAAMKAVHDPALKAEQAIGDAIREINAAQEKEVIANLPAATGKAIDPEKIFDLKHWIGITADAMAPILTDLYETEAKIAAEELGKPDLVPLSDQNAAVALHESIQRMATSYESTVLEAIEKNLNEGLAKGDSLADLTSAVKDVYEAASNYGAQRIAKTEAFRTANASLKETWKQSGVVKTIKWYTASAEPCPFCLSLNGTIISIDQNFLNQGDSLEVDGKTLENTYSDVGAPPLHPNCMCVARPEEIAI